MTQISDQSYPKVYMRHFYDPVRGIGMARDRAGNWVGVAGYYYVAAPGAKPRCGCYQPRIPSKVFDTEQELLSQGFLPTEDE